MLFFAVVLGLSGRAEAQGLTAEQEKGLAELKTMAMETTRLYRVPEVGITAASWVNTMGTANTYSNRGWIFLDPRILGGSVLRDALFAKLLAYHVLYWSQSAPRPYGTTAESYRRAREEQYSEANVKALEILMRVRGLAEATALESVYQLLLTQHRDQVTGRQSPRQHRRSACDEIKDLLGRFPQHREWWAKVECAPTVGRGPGHGGAKAAT
jgi:hypothetical protein